MTSSYLRSTSPFATERTEIFHRHRHGVWNERFEQIAIHNRETCAKLTKPTVLLASSLLYYNWGVWRDPRVAKCGRPMGYHCIPFDMEDRLVARDRCGRAN